mgnify:CR=1 FL=1
MIVASLFLILVTYFTYRFLLSPIKTKSEVKKFIPAFVVFGLLFVLVAIFSLSEWLTRLSPRNLTPITSIAELSQVTPSAPNERPKRILLVGDVGSENAFQLVDGLIETIPHEDFVLINAYPSAQTAVLYGTLTHQGVVTDVIYVGRLEAYFAFLDRFAIIPILTIVISLMGALVTWMIPIRKWRALNHTSTKPLTENLELG